MELFAAAFAALYAAHHVGDYWIQTDHQAQHKGAAGAHGRLACLAHVATYTVTQALFLAMVLPLGAGPSSWWLVAASLGISAVTHYAADRREHGLMIRFARRVTPWNARLLELGKPRAPWALEVLTPCGACSGEGWSGVGAYAERCTDCLGRGTLPAEFSREDNPSLGTGAWALDQSWHIALGVFLPALVISL